MEIKGVGIGRGVAVGSVIRMAAPLPEPSDAPRADTVPAQKEIDRVTKSLAVVNADLSRRAEEAANGDEGAKKAAPILQAISMFASDPSLAASITSLINGGKTAERAVLEGFAAWPSWIAISCASPHGRSSSTTTCPIAWPSTRRSAWPRR